MKESVRPQNHSTDFKELKLAVTESTLPPCCKVLDFSKVQYLQRFCMIIDSIRTNESLTRRTKRKHF